MNTDTKKADGEAPPTPEEVSAAAAVLGRMRTPARAAASRANARAPRPTAQGVAKPEEVRAKMSAAAKERWAAKKAAGETWARGKEPVPLDQIACTCDGGDTLDHKSTCPRGRAIYRRRKAGTLPNGSD